VFYIFVYFDATDFLRQQPNRPFLQFSQEVDLGEGELSCEDLFSPKLKERLQRVLLISVKVKGFLFLENNSRISMVLAVDWLIRIAIK